MSSERRGKLFVFSAPSGAGKTTLVGRVMGERPDLTFSISYTTRPKRDGEVNERDYHFLDRATFERMRDANEFLEHADVFGNYYGTGRDQVESLRNAGRDVLLEIDWQGAQQVRTNQPDCYSVFILPPSVAELERRLRGRKTDSEDVIARRLGEAVDDISHWSEFDHVVVNDDVESATRALLAIISDTPAGTSTADPGVRERTTALLGT
jgi:guanylate kinase